MLRATEMDFWRRFAGISRRERIRNEKVCEIMGVKNTIVRALASRDFRSIDSYSIYSNVKNRLLGCSRVFAANTLRIDCFH